MVLYKDTTAYRALLTPLVIKLLPSMNRIFSELANGSQFLGDWPAGSKGYEQ